MPEGTRISFLYSSPGLTSWATFVPPFGLGVRAACLRESDDGRQAAARKSYQDFLILWKDADPDIPIYKQAKAEYAKLR